MPSPSFDAPTPLEPSADDVATPTAEAIERLVAHDTLPKPAEIAHSSPSTPVDELEQEHEAAMQPTAAAVSHALAHEDSLDSDVEPRSAATDFDKLDDTTMEDEIETPAVAQISIKRDPPQDDFEAEHDAAVQPDPAVVLDDISREMEDMPQEGIMYTATVCSFCPFLRLPSALLTREFRRSTRTTPTFPSPRLSTTRTQSRFPPTSSLRHLRSTLEICLTPPQRPRRLSFLLHWCRMSFQRLRVAP